MTERGDRDTLQVEPFPSDLKRRLKAQAALSGLRMSDAVAEAVTRWCEEREAGSPVLAEVSERGAGHASG